MWAAQLSVAEIDRDSRNQMPSRSPLRGWQRKGRAEGQVPFARPLMFFIIFGGRLPQFATAIWTASLYNRALSATEVKQLYNAGR
jgi:hypothetical protein